MTNHLKEEVIRQEGKGREDTFSASDMAKNARQTEAHLWRELHPPDENREQNLFLQGVGVGSAGCMYARGRKQELKGKEKKVGTKGLF